MDFIKNTFTYVDEHNSIQIELSYNNPYTAAFSNVMSYNELKEELEGSDFNE